MDDFEKRQSKAHYLTNWTKDTALELLKKYISNRIDVLEITDTPSQPCYLLEPAKGYWYISFSIGGEPLSIGGTRTITISKKTGKIVFDGLVGD